MTFEKDTAQDTLVIKLPNKHTTEDIQSFLYFYNQNQSSGFKEKQLLFFFCGKFNIEDYYVRASTGYNSGGRVLTQNSLSTGMNSFIYIANNYSLHLQSTGD